MQWRASGGPFLLGKLVPVGVGCIGLFAVAEGLFVLQDHGWRDALAPSVILLGMALLAGWLAWKFLRTVWLIVLAEDTLTCFATMGCWTLQPGEVLAVKGDAYNQFLHIVTQQHKISVWATFGNRRELLRAIQRANPHAEFAPWIDH
jgi:hypothetical protein